jgi:mRNA-degrading endonuclease RelE of RelBE toxin-antitoxin system
VLVTTPLWIKTANEYHKPHILIHGEELNVGEKTPHQWLIRMDRSAQDYFDHLPTSVKQGIFRQLEQILKADNPYALPFTEKLHDPKFAQARKFRVGDYRVIYVMQAQAVTHSGTTYKGTIFVVSIGDRKNVY